MNRLPLQTQVPHVRLSNSQAAMPILSRHQHPDIPHMRLRHRAVRLKEYCLNAFAMALFTIHSASFAASIDKPLAGNEGIARPYDVATDAPVLIVLGQSNAVGWTNPMPVAERGDCTQLSHVKGLSQARHYRLGLTSVTWEPYSCGGFVVSGGAYNDGWAYHLPGEFAKMWQQQAVAALSNISASRLPNLYIIHVGWGGQGIGESDVTPQSADQNRWWPGRNPNNVESLYPQTRKLLALAFRNLLDSGKKPRVIGLHWNQWETDNAYNWVTSTDVATRTWGALLNGFRETLGGANFPIYLYRPRSTVYSRNFWGGNTTYFDRITNGLTALAGDSANNFRLIDPADATNTSGTSMYNALTSNYTYGIFAPDTVHYTKAVQQWFARKQWSLIESSHLRGAEVTRVVMPTDNLVTPTPLLPVAGPVPDYNGDGRSGLLLNSGGASYVIWAMNGTAIKAINPGRTQAADWRVVAQADFNGDGQADVLWQQSGTGRLKLWSMHNGVVASELGVSQALADGWQIAASGDFDGDHKTDVLLNHSATGRYVIWFMDGAVVRSGAEIRSPASDARVIATADFNADKKSDILWGQTNGPGVAIWLMNGASLMSAQNLESAASGYRPIAVADFNGDRQSDILWVNSETSSYVVWHMSGLIKQSAQAVTQPAVGWTLEAVGNFDQDGKADLLWRQATTGQLILWLLAGRGTAQPGSGAVQTPPMGWSMVH